MRKVEKLFGCRIFSGRPFLILLGITVKKYAFSFNISSDFNSWFRYSLCYSFVQWAFVGGAIFSKIRAKKYDN